MLVKAQTTHQHLQSGKRALVLIMDGLGVGAMEDAPQQQRDANTVTSVVTSRRRALLPTLGKLGLFAVADGRLGEHASRAALGYPGADSYLGHNELMGGDVPDTSPDTVRGRRKLLVDALKQAGFRVEEIADGGALWINEGILLSDNLENEPGMAINLAGTLDSIDLPTLYQAAQIVREQVRNARVIAFASPHIDPRSIKAAVHHTPEGLTGIITPEVGFYKEGYQVRHFGAGFDPKKELPYILSHAGYQVELIGKIADVAAGIGSDDIPRCPIVDTPSVLRHAEQTWQRLTSGLIVATVQETDLAGHAQDAARIFSILQETDAWLARFLHTHIHEESLFILTADHGNDPCYGTHHTREYVPVLAYGALPYSLEPLPNLKGVAAIVRSFFGL